MRRRKPQQQKWGDYHWTEDVVPVVLGLIAVGICIYLFIGIE